LILFKLEDKIYKEYSLQQWLKFMYLKILSSSVLESFKKNSFWKRKKYIYWETCSFSGKLYLNNFQRTDSYCLT
jgi:hypothetical protein